VEFHCLCSGGCKWIFAVRHKRLAHFLVRPTNLASEAGHGWNSTLAACHMIGLRRKALKRSGKHREWAQGKMNQKLKRIDILCQTS
jgi:hypothetical protein